MHAFRNELKGRGSPLAVCRLAGDPSGRLQVAPDADAYLVLGVANYILGSQTLHKRLILRFAGIRGDKGEGIQQLGIVAARGRYLRPFAKILLAMAALREKQTELARAQLTELVAEFRQNSLFVDELAKVVDPTQRLSRGRNSTASPPARMVRRGRR
jgi:hypothetical protein